MLHMPLFSFIFDIHPFPMLASHLFPLHTSLYNPIMNTHTLSSFVISHYKEYFIYITSTNHVITLECWKRCYNMRGTLHCMNDGSDIRQNYDSGGEEAMWLVGIELPSSIAWALSFVSRLPKSQQHAPLETRVKDIGVLMEWIDSHTRCT